MPIFDLPPELWLEILSNLPRNILPSMIGVSRTLFEMALTYLYENVHISHGREARRSLEQVGKYPDVARRVRSITVHPHSPRVVVQPTSPQDKLLTWLFRSKFPSKRFVSSSKEADLLNATLKAVKYCSNLHEITLITCDIEDRSTFLRFADSLWTLLPIRSNFTKLIIDTICYLPSNRPISDSKRPLIVQPSRFSVSPGDSRISLDISVNAGYIPKVGHIPIYPWKDGCKLLIGFMNSFTNSISSITISSTLVREDIGDLFKGLAFFPNLQEFKFFAVFNYQTFHNKQLLTTFLQRHANNLETLTIKPKLSMTTSHVAFGTYSTWLSHEPPEHMRTFTSFTQLFFPRLHALEIGLSESRAEDSPPLLPDLYHVAPTLTKLVMTDVELTIESLSRILNGLSRIDNEIILEELSYTCNTISPHTFDYLSAKLPRLKSLAIECASDCSAEFYATMKTRQYLRWPVRCLRLSIVHSCGHGHPSKLDMMVVASAISPDVVLDTEWHCLCTPLHRNVR